MQIKGKVHKFGDNVNTDEIIPARYLNIREAGELARHCMEDIDKEFVKKMDKGDIIVAGNNFGCGSSREQAPLTIKTAGVSCVLAKSFARIFYRNAINIGLPIFETKDAEDISQGDLLEVNPEKGEIKNLTRNKTYRTQSFPEFIQEIISAGGLMKWVKERM
jgi:3-isopropylmalate/(R)-2-methylmalate dehydratase small subunit